MRTNLTIALASACASIALACAAALVVSAAHGPCDTDTACQCVDCLEGAAP